MAKNFLLLRKVLLPPFFVSLCLALISGSVWAKEFIIKIPVTKEGVYQITYNDIGFYGQPYGIDPKQIDPRQIHLYDRDKDVAVYVYGEEDGQFNAGDYIEFYGIPIQPDDPEYKYTEENVYYLKVNAGTPVRMSSWESPGGGMPQDSFLNTFHAEQNWTYWETMPDGLGLDHWFWGQKIPAGSKQVYTLNISNIASTSQKAAVRVYIHGRTDDIAEPDHRTEVTLNGTSLGDVVWDGQKPIIHSFDISQSLLKGENTITFEEAANPGVVVDSVYVNWVELDYYKNFAAEGDRLKFRARGTGTHTFSISNFSHPAIMVFDVSNPQRVRRLNNPAVTLSGDKYTLKFSDDISGEAEYLAIAIPTTKTIPFIFQTTPLTLKSKDNGADYLIITHDSFKDAMLPLAQHREKQGYRVKIVTTQEIYDEFSGGIFTPLAIKDFLRYAYENWKGPAPEFVLLVGDANVDYKDNWETGQINYVPVYVVDTSIVGETPSDHWFVTVAGDDPLPDMFIGRIPAKTAGEVTMVVNKIIGYETGGKYDWSKRVLLAANDQDPRFEEYSEEWITHLPADYSPSRIYVSSYSDKSQPGKDLLKNLNDGVLMTSFFGHGNVDLWAASQDAMLLTSDDAASPSLANQGRYPFVAGLNCLNGLFAEPAEGKWITLPDGTHIKYAVPLPEALLFQDGRGALAMWSPSAFAYPDEQRWIGHELFSGIFEQGNNILGSVTTMAKVNAYIKKGVYVENLDVFTFFGDPATLLAVDIQKNSSGDSGKGGGGCFIATAAYGSYFHPYVHILRDFRDKVLLQTQWGKRVVDTYYRISPPAAEWISKREWARAIVRMTLLPLVFIAWFAIGASGWTQGGFLLMPPVIMLGIVLMRQKRLRRYVIFLTIISSILWIGLGGNSTAFASGPDDDLILIRSDETGLVVELIIPSYRVVEEGKGKSAFDKIEVMDYGSLRKTGSPEVPMRGTLIAIPENGDVSLTVTAGEYETRRLRMRPASGEDIFYPGTLAVRGFTGYMRDQRVMQILFYPVQYNPVTGEARIYKKISVAVDFGGSAQILKKAVRKDMGTSSSATNSGAYEKLLKGLLLNYSAVR